MNRKFILIALSLVGVGALALLAVRSPQHLWETIFPPGSKVHTSSTRPIDIVLRENGNEGGLRLRIPKAYLVNAANWRGGDQQTLRIEARLPNLEPAAVSRLDNADDQNRSVGLASNELVISVLAARSDRPPSLTSYRERLSNRKRSIGNPLKFELTSMDYFGLEQYREWRCSATDPSGQPSSTTRSDEQCSDGYRDYFVPHEDGTSLIYLVCTIANPAAPEVQTGCQATSRFQNNLVNYIFRRNEISRWRDFDRAVQELLTRFADDAIASASDMPGRN